MLLLAPALRAKFPTTLSLRVPAECKLQSSSLVAALDRQDLRDLFDVPSNFRRSGLTQDKCKQIRWHGYRASCVESPYRSPVESAQKIASPHTEAHKTFARYHFLKRPLFRRLLKKQLTFSPNTWIESST